MSSAPIGRHSDANREAWLFGRWTDLLIGCGLGYILSVPLLFYVGETTGTTAWPAALVLLMGLLLNSPHYGATIVRVYDARDDRRKYALFSVYMTAALALLLATATWSVWVASLVITLYLTWSPWHFSGQNYGLMLMFLRRRGIDVDQTTKRLVYLSFVLSATLAILAVHAGNEDLVFAPSTLRVANTPTLLYLPVPPGVAQVIVPAALLAYLGCLGGAAWRLQRGARWRELAPALVIVLTQALWFAIPALALDWTEARGRTLFFAAVWVSTAHSVQYLWVTAYYARSSGSATTVRRFLLKSFAAGTAVTTLPAIVMAPHLLGRIPFDAGLAAIVFSIVNIHHFILDGAIWKLRDGRVARVLLRSPDSLELPEPIDVPRRRPWIRRLVWTAAALTIAVPVVRNHAINAVHRTNDPERIESSLRLLRWSGFETTEIQFNIGRRMAASGDHARAIQHFARSLELFPTARVWAALGVQYRALGRWDLALAAFESALELDTSAWALHYRRAEALLETAPTRAEARPQAIAALERALELSPGAPGPQELLTRLRAE